MQLSQRSFEPDEDNDLTYDETSGDRRHHPGNLAMITKVPALRLDHLEHPGVRDRMLAEWTQEIADLERRLPRGKWPFGSDLNAAGWTASLKSMPVALVQHDMAWLASVMNDPRLWRPARIQMRRGHPIQVRINIPDAAVKLAHCEYDMAYTRAVAGLALDKGDRNLQGLPGRTRRNSASSVHLSRGRNRALRRHHRRSPRVLHRRVRRDLNSSRPALSPHDTDTGMGRGRCLDILAHTFDGGGTMSHQGRRLAFGEEWVLGERIGAGGFGEVFAASSSRCERAVAKFVPKSPGADREMLFADLTDVRNVVPIIDSGGTDEAWVLIMPRADQSLREHITSADGALATDACIAILVDLATALSDLDGRVVHRDLKPENVLFFDGHWCLADFGISRYAEATTAPDTRKYAMSQAYAAPERWRGERATSSTDVYALGIIAHELLAGCRPFVGPQVEDYRDQHLYHDPPVLAAVPDRLRALVDECLYKAAGARPSANALVTRLRRAGEARRSPGLERLEAANRQEVSRRGAASRLESEHQSDSQRRLELAQAASKSLADIIGELRETILAAAPAATQRQRPNGGWVIQLGDAELRFAGARTAQNDGGQRPSGLFEVIAYSSLSVHIPSDEYGYEGRGHSLWFCDAQRPAVYAWFETSFMITPGIRRSSPQTPFALAPDEDAREAIGPGIGAFQVAWPFTSLVVGELDDFIDRWSVWLAEGAAGVLRYPSSMPERQTEGSWRR